MGRPCRMKPGSMQEDIVVGPSPYGGLPCRTQPGMVPRGMQPRRAQVLRLGAMVVAAFAYGSITGSISPAFGHSDLSDGSLSHSWPLRFLALPPSGPLVLPQRFTVRRLEEQAVNDEHLESGCRCFVVRHFNDLAYERFFYSCAGEFRTSVRASTCLLASQAAFRSGTSTTCRIRVFLLTAGRCGIWHFPSVGPWCSRSGSRYAAIFSATCWASCSSAIHLQGKLVSSRLPSGSCGGVPGASQGVGVRVRPTAAVRFRGVAGPSSTCRTRCGLFVVRASERIALRRGGFLHPPHARCFRLRLHAGQVCFCVRTAPLQRRRKAFDFALFMIRVRA